MSTFSQDLPIPAIDRRKAYGLANKVFMFLPEAPPWCGVHSDWPALKRALIGLIGERVGLTDLHSWTEIGVVIGSLDFGMVDYWTVL